MKYIRTANYVYNQQGGIAHAIVSWSDGTTETIPGTDTSRLIQVQEQMKNQNKQVLMETEGA